jgi:plasmid stabilization system protein ParE
MRAEKKVAEFVRQDLKEAALWYEKAAKGLGKLFLKEINEKVSQISANPLAHEIRYSNIRVAFTRRFPYGIHYEYIQSDNLIIILAVFHTSINPRAWEER